VRNEAQYCNTQKRVTWQTPLPHRATLAGGETRATNRLKPRGQKQQEAERQYDFKVASPKV